MTGTLLPGDEFTVSCAKHGPMQFRFSLDWWDCAGWDGEGCETRVTGLELTEILAGRPLDSVTAGSMLGWMTTRDGCDDAWYRIAVVIYGPGCQEEYRRAFAERPAQRGRSPGG